MSSAFDARELSALWNRRWPACRPVGHELRGCAADRWVRFHSLPDGKRYAENPDEHAEVLRRHHCVLTDLRAAVPRPNDSYLWVVTTSGSDTAEVAPRWPDLVAAMPIAAHWQSLDYGHEADHRVWMHLWSSRVASGTSIAGLLLLAAADQAHDVIIADVGLEWLYHPYDGGADVIAPSAEIRDSLRNTHAAWLSRRPSGL